MTEINRPAARANAQTGRAFDTRDAVDIARKTADSQEFLRLVSFKTIGKSGLAGFASVELDNGLRLHDVPVFSSGTGGPWAGLPRRPQLDRDRHQRIGPDGKPAFEPVAEWRDRDAANAFSAAVVEAVRRAHPDAFEARAA